MIYTAGLFNFAQFPFYLKAVYTQKLSINVTHDTPTSPTAMSTGLFNV